MPNKMKDDRFIKFGTVSFTSNTKVNDFIDYLKDGRVVGTKCDVCGESFFPPRADCCSCLSSSMNWFDIVGSGSLISFSELKFAPKGFEKDLPYTIALLDFGKHKVFGRIDDSVEMSNILVGMKMGISIKHLEEGRLSYSFYQV